MRRCGLKALTPTKCSKNNSAQILCGLGGIAYLCVIELIYTVIFGVVTERLHQHIAPNGAN